MKPTTIISAILGLTSLIPISVLAQAPASGDARPYLVFKETASPDGRYAVAWGLPKHPDVWAKVSEFGRQHSTEQELSITKEFRVP